MNNKPGSLAELGQGLEHLGKLMQDKTATIEQLASAAEACGLSLGLSFRTVETEDTPEEQA